MKIFCPLLFLRTFVRKIIIKTFVVEFIFSKILCFQHNLLVRFSQMRLKYEKYSLRRILFQTLNQYSVRKSLIAKPFDGSRAKMKAASPVQVIKNSKQCFQLCLDWSNTLVLTTHFLHPRSKVRALRKTFVLPYKSF